VTIKKEDAERLTTMVEDAYPIGFVTDGPRLTIQTEDGIIIDDELSFYENAWKGAIPCLMTAN
jgi:phosphoribosylformylglycinamidine synthase